MSNCGNVHIVFLLLKLYPGNGSNLVLLTHIHVGSTVDVGYKNTGYKNISVIRTIVCDPFLSFPIEKVPVIRTYRI